MKPEDLPDQIAFGQIERKVMEALVEKFGRWVPTGRLVAVAWADDPSGGPEAAENAIKSHVHNLRRKIKSSGFTIEGYSGVGRRLIRRDDPQSSAI